MQPVTIKNKQYSNTLWLSQGFLCLLMIMVLWVGSMTSLWMLFLLPVVVFVFYVNHQTITEQSKLQFTMRTNGQLVLDRKNTDDAGIYPYPANDEDLVVSIQRFWHLPRILLLKLKVKHLKKPVYITLFSTVIKADKFSHLLVGLTQLNAAINES